MRIPNPIIPFRAPPKPVTVLRSGSSDVTEVPYIRCLNCRMPEAFELWDLADNGVREVHSYARVNLLPSSGKILFTISSSMCDDSIFLFWVVEL